MKLMKWLFPNSGTKPCPGCGTRQANIKFTNPKIGYVYTYCYDCRETYLCQACQKRKNRFDFDPRPDPDNTDLVTRQKNCSSCRAKAYCPQCCKQMPIEHFMPTYKDGDPIKRFSHCNHCRAKMESQAIRLKDYKENQSSQLENPKPSPAVHAVKGFLSTDR